MTIERALHEFLVEIEVRKYTPKTIRSYKVNLNLFLRFCRDELGVYEMDEMSNLEVKKFTSFMVSRGRKGTYINGILKSIKSFIQYCHEEELGGFNTKKVFKWCKEERPVIMAFSPSDVRHMLKSCRGNDYIRKR